MPEENLESRGFKESGGSFNSLGIHGLEIEYFRVGQHSRKFVVSAPLSPVLVHRIMARLEALPYVKGVTTAREEPFTNKKTFYVFLRWFIPRDLIARRIADRIAAEIGIKPNEYLFFSFV